MLRHTLEEKGTKHIERAIQKKKAMEHIEEEIIILK